MIPCVSTGITLFLYNLYEHFGLMSIGITVAIL